MIKLNLKDDLSFLSDHVSIHVHKQNLSKVLAAFAIILANKDELIQIVGCAHLVSISQGGKKYSSADMDGTAFQYHPDEQMLKTIVCILSDMVLEKKFDANHIDFDLRTKTGTLGLTFQFADCFYEALLPWQR
ncbi:hypothetical protein [Rhizobium sp. AC27/96]|uniref:hypothetical protein n=1 Tax=Rhizobium sp. AC27/96 TaxID=1841653 RepID=UPI0011472D93|nr:hypothetical protein [Rhizobium sp. AC27/96]